MILQHGLKPASTILKCLIWKPTSQGRSLSSSSMMSTNSRKRRSGNTLLLKQQCRSLLLISSSFDVSISQPTDNIARRGKSSTAAAAATTTSSYDDIDLFKKRKAYRQLKEKVEKSTMLIMDRLRKNSAVRMKNPAEVEAKIQKIIHDGYDKLLVISDFDYTLSRYHDAEGKRCLTTHGVFDECTREFNPELADKCQELVKKYIPIEFCPTMSVEEKIPHMETWWKLSHEYIVDAKFTYEDIEKFVSKARIFLRDAAVEFVRSVEAHNVPLVLFSAGIGNIIEIILKRNLGHTPTGLHLISNCMNFDENNVCVSFTEPVIHTFCKNSSVMTGERPFFHHIRNRTNLILLGDSLGDIHMDVGMINEGAALKIGYLNWDFDKLYDKYLESYDIVLLDCQSMELPLEIFRFCGISHAPSEVNLVDYCHAAKAEKKVSEDDIVAATNVSA